MKKIKKYLSIMLLSCLFLSIMQVSVYAASYVLSGSGYKTCRVGIRNNMVSFSSYLSPSVNAWNNATSRVGITIDPYPISNNTIDALNISDSYYGLNGVGSDYFFITINSVKNTTYTVQSVIVHEFGHIFNLAENNNNVLVPVPIMNQYRDRTVVKIPSSIDIDGVNASYSTSGTKY